jgi:hypothetical protein
MATIHQIDAKRGKARKGNATSAVKREGHSSMKAPKPRIDPRSGIIRGEDIESFTKLMQAYVDQFRPKSPEERHYVDVMIRADWQFRRLSRADTEIWNEAIRNASPQVGENALVCAFHNAGHCLVRVQQHADTVSRRYGRALRELLRLRTAGHGRPEPPNPASSAKAGFVFSNSVQECEVQSLDQAA